MSERPVTSELLNGVRNFIARYVILPGAEYYDAMALWVLHSHAINIADSSPRLIIKSPEKECGKTRVLETLEVLTLNPLNTINATVPAIYRSLMEKQSTLLFDEVDAIFSIKAAKEHEDLRALINGGYRRGATVLRVVGEGKRMKVEQFPVFAATALAAIGDLPDTIESRAIIVPMRRRAPDETVASFRRRHVEGDAEGWRGVLTQWAEIYSSVLVNDEPQMPSGVTDRAADIWEPLLAIGELAGDGWEERARQAATFIVKGRVAEDLSTGVRLLADVKAVMGDLDRISSADLCAKLNGLEEAAWGGWNDGRGINQRELARRLGKYGIRPKVVRMPDGHTPSGYLREDFADPWSRYLREVPGGSSTRSTTSTQIRIHVEDVEDVEDTRPKRDEGPVAVYKVSDNGTTTYKMDDPPGDLRCCAGQWVSFERLAEHAASHGFEVVLR